MEIALSKFCSPEDIISPLSREEEDIRLQFSGLKSQNYLAPIWKYTLYDVLRCCWYKILKGYYDHISVREVKQLLDEGIWNSYFKFAIDRNPWDKVISYFFWTGANAKYPNIESFLNKENVAEISSFEQLSIGGVLALDKIYKYEELNDALFDISKQLNLPEIIKMPEYRAKGDFRADKRDYKEILSKKEADLISTMFAREIKVMNYQY